LIRQQLIRPPALLGQEGSDASVAEQVV